MYLTVFQKIEVCNVLEVELLFGSITGEDFSTMIFALICYHFFATVDSCFKF